MVHLVHQLDRSDRPALLAHLLALDAADRRLRFGRSMDARALGDYAESIDFGRDALFGVRAGGTGEAARLAGATHLSLYDGAADLGLSVLPGYRRRGIAAAMFDRAALHARNRGTIELFMHCLSESRAMRALARRAGMAILVEGRDADAWIELPPANAFTVGQELYERQLTLVDATLRAQLALARSLAAA